MNKLLGPLHGALLISIAITANVCGALHLCKMLFTVSLNFQNHTLIWNKFEISQCGLGRGQWEGGGTFLVAGAVYNAIFSSVLSENVTSEC